jgi:adenosylcobinamide kinase / adenosylcobinamide-phosphate guanylyltransferase
MLMELDHFAMNKITLLLGGSSSGKSQYALEEAKKLNKKTAFIATASPGDNEMSQRITKHKKERPSHWTTFEESADIIPTLKKIGSQFDIVIIDCLTFLIFNLSKDNSVEENIEKRVRELVKVLKSANHQTIIVSNEVGLGIVPENPMARRFRDLAGKINQIVAQEADKVFFIVSGLPMQVK